MLNLNESLNEIYLNYDTLEMLKDNTSESEILEMFSNDLNYSKSLESKSDMQLCIDNALLGANDAYYDYINNEIIRRNVDCSIYSEQVSTARAASQSTQTAVMTVVLVLAALFGFASGASGG